MHPHLRLRTRHLTSHPPATKARYVLCWLKQALRGTHNPVLDVALHHANDLGLPLLVYHGLDDRYPYASKRLHQFILEASISLAKDLKARGIRFVRHVRRPKSTHPGLLFSLCDEAAMLVTDDEATFVSRSWTQHVASKITIPCLAVDAALAVPRGHLANTFLPSTKAFRAAHKTYRQEHCVTLEPLTHDATMLQDAFSWHDPLESPEQIDALISTCDIDHTLPVATQFPGDRQTALARVDDLIEHVLARYKFDRNNPSLPHSTAKLSPYLHFGVLDAREVAQRVMQASHVHSAARWKFLDELLTWREFSHHWAYHSEVPASWVNLPNWALNTLILHQYDPRDELYSLDDLLHARTSDDVWNAAQKQFVCDGWMHNNLRMYWGKRLIAWCKSPRVAWITACYLNDRLSLDGRDPSTYGGIRWCFGQSKRARYERDVYGFVPTKSDYGIRRRTGMKAWLEDQTKRSVPELQLPDNLEKVATVMGYIKET